MTGSKTNERPGTRASLKGFHMSASKARVVLNLIRGEDVKSALHERQRERIPIRGERRSGRRLPPLPARLGGHLKP